MFGISAKDSVALDEELGSPMMKAVCDINYFNDISVTIPDTAFSYLDMSQDAIVMCVLFAQRPALQCRLVPPLCVE